MKFRKSRPSIAASMGRMIVLSIPNRPDASPERKTVTASVHSSAVTGYPLSLRLSHRLAVERSNREFATVGERPLAWFMLGCSSLRCCLSTETGTGSVEAQSVEMTPPLGPER